MANAKVEKSRPKLKFADIGTYIRKLVLKSLDFCYGKTSNQFRAVKRQENVEFGLFEILSQPLWPSNGPKFRPFKGQ